MRHERGDLIRRDEVRVHAGTAPSNSRNNMTMLRKVSSDSARMRRTAVTTPRSREDRRTVQGSTGLR
jgi:hypothetical protein